jgi:hypothetical protein
LVQIVSYHRAFLRDLVFIDAVASDNRIEARAQFQGQLSHELPRATSVTFTVVTTAHAALLSAGGGQHLSPATRNI